jgi:FtsH-binding integral membrane protein
LAGAKAEGMTAMAEFDNRYARMRPGARTDVAVDEGLRAYMLRVYNYMAGGVFLTGLIAYFAFTQAITMDPALAAKSAGGLALALKRGMYLTQFGATLYVSPLKWLVMLAPLGFVFFLSWRIYQMSVSAAQLTFWLFAGVMGLSLSTIFLVFTGQSITQVFFVTAAAFGGLSLYGYTTQKDLSGWGSFLIMGVIGIIIAALVNLFLQSSALQFAISVIGVLVFAGLTAYDTQQIKDNYYSVMGDMTATSKAAIMGALNLYLDFINMFTMLLQLFGNRD